jgi:hypothetical protein
VMGGNGAGFWGGGACFCGGGGAGFCEGAADFGVGDFCGAGAAPSDYSKRVTVWFHEGPESLR